MATLMEDLQRLGSEPDEIAGTLREIGICGEINEPEHCPIANYLKDLGYEHVSVALDDEGHLVASTANEETQIPAALSRFVNWFDRGLYRELSIEGV